ncbi:outer membrane beta-barrel protein [Fulvivirga lutea]|uniref:Outer membrane beta-barrel protein n=1 Tax=Fulvivirga lutea TaxID=2810512 RepID=A0A974WIX7_9BACT|nr:outer membrane beta-barrel protein [Fulvivirga lutea]QSE96995.1 outer membrane beta-barrel protein [Fulvivirga lutea]
MRISIIILIIAISAVPSFGQNKLLLETGGSLFSYSGDMGSFDQAGGGFHVGIRLNKKRKLNGSFQLILGSVSDDDPEQAPPTQAGTVAPNKYFKTNFFGVNYALNYHFIKNERWWIYLSQGIGFLRFTPKDANGQSLVNATNTRNDGEDYRNTSAFLPTSVGAIYYLSGNVGLGISLSMLNTATDYLDNISELGTSGNDNIFQAKFSLIIPLQIAAKSD